MADRKYIVIAEKIRLDIEKGVYVEGGRIPPIRDLAARYDANPQTVNKATAYLESQGLLELRRGAGSTVRKQVAPVAPVAQNKVLMLIDRERARLLADLNNLASYHGKDVYLSYMMEASKRGFGSGFIVYDRDEAPSRQFLSVLKEASAFFIQGTLPDAYFKYLFDADIPAVLINRKAPPGPGRIGSVLIPDSQIREMVSYLVSLGHSRFLFALSDRFEKSSLFEARLKILQDSMDGHGLDSGAVEIFIYSDFSGKDSERLSALVSKGFSAAVGFNDVSALGLYGLASRASISIPELLSVVGFDDIVLGQLVVPPLTTVRVDRKDLVAKAFTLLEVLSSHSSPFRVEVEIPTSLVIRQSAFRR